MKTILHLSLQVQCLVGAALLVVPPFTSAAALPNAWQITDNSSAGGSTLYYTNLLSTGHRIASTNAGFDFSIDARFATDYSTGSSSMMMLYSDGSRRWQILWSLTNGNLVSLLLTNVSPAQGSAFVVTSNGTGLGLYHTHQIIYNPTNNRASYLVDGQVLTTNWMGSTASGLAAGEVLWGAGSSSGQGQMNFNRVRFVVTNTLAASYNAGTNPALAPNPATQGWTLVPATPPASTATNALSPDVTLLPGNPTVATLPATNVQPYQATLSGIVNAGGLGATAWFEWGTSASYGNTTPKQFLPADTNAINFLQTITGLMKGTGYHFRCVVNTMSGVTNGQNVAFTTPQPPELQQQSGGFWGYITMANSPAPSCYGYGVSFYSSTWALLEKPLAGFQMGLPATWITPENATFAQALCPTGTVARSFPNAGNYQDYFQTIEGGMGFWGSTQFGVKSPKFRMNGTPNCYDEEISSPGWGFGKPAPLSSEKMGIAQLSNRLLVPPDGLTFQNGMNGELLGTAWMAMPYTEIAPQDEEYFALTTAFVECEKLFLESNKVAPGADLGGASFMKQRASTNTFFSGQHWKMVPAGNGYFALTTAFVESEGLFLEGNKVAPGADLDGASFMKQRASTNTFFSGQYWKMVPAGDGYFALTTAFVENEGLYLEGNKVGPGAFLGGAAFMSQRPSSNTFSSGQLWKKVSVTSRPPAHTGHFGWTLFVNSGGFKGPVAFWIPETWSKLSDSYPVVEGRGLDQRPGLMKGGAMEVNTVPYFQATNQGDVYMRIPKLLFPVDTNGNTTLMQDVTMYSSGALYDQARAWFNGGELISGRFNDTAAFTPTSTALPLVFKKGQSGPVITGFSPLVETQTLGNGSFGLQWLSPTNQGALPEYFKQVGTQFVAVASSEVPDGTYLKSQSFARAGVGQPYTSSGAQWTNPGPASSSFEVNLTDGTKVTYAWYKFVDQPALQHLNLTPSQKQRWQSIVEQIHTNWPVNYEYIPPPSRGTLATLDAALVVTPPSGLEVGYVPIVTRQETNASGVYTQLLALQLEGWYERNPVENGYHLGSVTLALAASGTYRWTNQAGVTWTLLADLAHGVLLTGSDFSYTNSPNISIILKRHPITDIELPQVDGLMIVGEFYRRISGLSGRPYLTAKLEGGTITVSWDAGQTLQTAADVAGPWVTVSNAQNPYSVSANESKRFFRVVSP